MARYTRDGLVYTSEEHMKLMDECDRLQRDLYDQMDAASFLRSLGYTRCDIPACNCGSFHRRTDPEPTP